MILLALTSGAGLSWGATCASLHAVALERCGGALLVVGLLLLGAALPLLG
ncbi:MAG TPA: hypothetical protein VJ779_00515 [Acetobacteraceae bacterium]|nr:hypothetical protein [Acetobacteraceae bacterium]